MPARAGGGHDDDQRQQEAVERLHADGVEDDPGQNAKVTATARSHDAAGCYRRAWANAATSAPVAAAGSSASAASRTSRLPMITPSAPASAAAGRLLGRRDPEAERDRDVGVRPWRARRRRRTCPTGRRARRSCRSPRRCRGSRGRARRSARRRSSVVVGATSGTSASPAASQASSAAGASSSGRSGTISPLAPAAAASRGEALGPARQHEVRVGHQDDRQPRRERPRRCRARRRRVVPAASARVRRGLDHRPVGDRVGERHAELDQVGAAVRVGLRRSPATSRGPGSPPIR